MNRMIYLCALALLSSGHAYANTDMPTPPESNLANWEDNRNHGLARWENPSTEKPSPTASNNQVTLNSWQADSDKSLSFDHLKQQLAQTLAE